MSAATPTYAGGADVKEARSALSNDRSSNSGAGWMLVGAGGHARSVFDVLRRAGEQLLGVCSQLSRPSWLPDECVCLGDGDIERAPAQARWLVAIGDCSARQRFSERIEKSGRRLGILVGSTSTVASDALVSPGAMILEHAHIGPGSEIGASTIVNTAAVVEHDCRVGSFSHIGPRAVILGAGSVGRATFVGSSAVVLPGVRVGDGAVVGAGAVVTRGVADDTLVRGVPAHPPVH